MVVRNAAGDHVIDTILTLDKEDLTGAAVELVEARQRLKGAIALQAVTNQAQNRAEDKESFLKYLNHCLELIDCQFKVLAKSWQDEQEDGIAGCFHGLRYDVTKVTEQKAK